MIPRDCLVILADLTHRIHTIEMPLLVTDNLMVGMNELMMKVGETIDLNRDVMPPAHELNIVMIITHIDNDDDPEKFHLIEAVQSDKLAKAAMKSMTKN